MEIRRADAGDINAVKELFNYWYSVPRDGSSPDGFLSVTFNAELLPTLIARGWVVVATANGIVRGYYLVDGLEGSETAARRKHVETALVGRELEGKHVWRTQAAVHPEFTRRGVGHQCLNVLKTLVANEFDFLWGFIHERSANAMEAHQRSGWHRAVAVPGGWLAVVATGPAAESRLRTSFPQASVD